MAIVFAQSERVAVNQLQVVPTTEYSDVDIPVSKLLVGSDLEIYPEVGSRFFSIALRGRELKFRSGAFVGFIPINPRIAIDVRPRLGTPNIDHLVEVAGYSAVPIFGHSRVFATRSGSHLSLAVVLSLALAEQCERIGDWGLLKSYVELVQPSSYPKGRPLLGRTLAYRPRRTRPVLVASQFARTSDVGSNRAIKFAIWQLSLILRSAASPSREIRLAVAALNRCWHIFDSVELDVSGLWLHDPIVSAQHPLPANRSYYRGALGIARLVSRGRTPVFGEAPVRADTELPLLLLNMEAVFESYVRNVLSSATGLAGFAVLDGNVPRPDGAGKLLFDSGSSEHAAPDVVVQLGNRVLLVLEVKYKPYRSGPDRTDINQALAYGLSYRAPVVMIVHPVNSGELAGLARVGTLGALTTFRFGFDVERQPIMATEEAFVEAVRALIVDALETSEAEH